MSTFFLKPVNFEAWGLRVSFGLKCAICLVLNSCDFNVQLIFVKESSERFEIINKIFLLKNLWNVFLCILLTSNRNVVEKVEGCLKSHLCRGNESRSKYNQQHNAQTSTFVVIFVEISNWLTRGLKMFNIEVCTSILMLSHISNFWNKRGWLG